jgi:putative endonuclease
VYKSTLALGKRGEDQAVGFLTAHGYKILVRNYKTKLGEIDIIAQDADTICFIEVKTRTSSKFGSPREAISGFKRRRLAKAALIFLKEKKFLDRMTRFDVVSISGKDNLSKVDLLKGAFEVSSAYAY